MPMVSRICTQIILLDRGKAKYSGDNVSKAIDQYYTRFVNNDSNVVFDDGSIVLEEVKMVDAKTNEKITELNWGEDLKFYFRFRINKEIKIPQFSIIIFDKEQRPVAILEKNDINSKIIKNENIIEFYTVIENLQLSKGVYSINVSVNVSKSNEPFLRMNNILSFQIIHKEDTWQPFLLKTDYRVN